MRDQLTDVLADFPDLTQPEPDPVCEELVVLTRRYAAYVVTERRQAPMIDGLVRSRDDERSHTVAESTAQTTSDA